VSKRHPCHEINLVQPGKEKGVGFCYCSRFFFQKLKFLAGVTAYFADRFGGSQYGDSGRRRATRSLPHHRPMGQHGGGDRAIWRGLVNTLLDVPQGGIYQDLITRALCSMGGSVTPPTANASQAASP
jgi:hypothetical protein